MTIEDTLYRAVLDWLKVGCVAYGATPLTDSQVVRSKQVNAANVRPPKPYLTVNLVASDVPVGVDEDVDAVSGSDPHAPCMESDGDCERSGLRVRAMTG